MGYEVRQSAEETVITIDGTRIKVSLAKPGAGTAFALGTLYKEDRGFAVVKVYLFQAINEDAAPEILKKAAGFFFASLLDTELFVLEIPRDSALFSQESQRIFSTGDYERAV